MILLDRIDHQGIIKVADFGLSKKLYEKIYVRHDKAEAVKLPIKWMAIESMTDRIFSEKTDVVSVNINDCIGNDDNSIDIVVIWCDLLGNI